MSKYEPLGQFLGHLQGDYWRPTFLELERILEFDLPASARKSEAWWMEEPRSDRSHAHAWLDGGWRPEHVDLEKERVTFRRGPPVAASEGFDDQPLVQRAREAPSPVFVTGVVLLIGFAAAFLLVRRSHSA